MNISLNRNYLVIHITAFVLMAVAGQSHAETYGGVSFPQGQISFADSVVSYNPDGGYAIPSPANSDPSKALNAPQIAGNTAVSACSDVNLCQFVSLGDGGHIVLKFEDNLLTGSDDDNLDLWVFEVGPDVEDTFVDISKDGINWISVGKVYGTTSGIDIDAYGFTSDDHFQYVRLTDDGNEGGQSGASVGADIDAIGAISTVKAPTSCTLADEELAFVKEESYTEGYVEGMNEGYKAGVSDGIKSVEMTTIIQTVEVPIEVIKEVEKIVTITETIELIPVSVTAELIRLRARITELENQLGERHHAHKNAPSKKHKEKDDNGHGNDEGKYDPSNPGKSKR